MKRLRAVARDLLRNRRSDRAGRADNHDLTARDSLPQRGLIAEDVIGLREERISGRVPLLLRVMENGICLTAGPALSEIQGHFRADFDALPQKYKSIYEINRFPVRLSERLIAAQKAA